MRDPLLLPLAGFGLGVVWAAVGVPGAPYCLGAACALTVLSVAAFRINARQVAMSALLAASFAAGATWAEFRQTPPPPLANAASGERVVVSGCVIEPAQIRDGRARIQVEVAEHARVRLTVALPDDRIPEAWSYGHRLEAEAMLRRPLAYRNPGGFDLERYLAREETYWIGAVSSPEDIRSLDGRCGNRFDAWLDGVRRRASARLDLLYAGNSGHRALMKALILGDESSLRRVYIEQFRQTGTYHALVISGSHVTFLTGLFLLWLRWFRYGRIGVLALAAITAWLYALLAGGQAPAMRAAMGFLLYCGARLLHRRPHLLNLVAAVALIFLLMDPWQLFDASFQLSFLAAGALAALAAPATDRWFRPMSAGLRRVHDDADRTALPVNVQQALVELRLAGRTLSAWTPWSQQRCTSGLATIARVALWFAELTLVSALVQIALVLPMVLYFHRLSLSGLSANVLAVPWLTFAIPAGSLTALTGWRLPAAIGGGLLDITQGIVGWHAAREPFWRVPDPPVWLAALFLASLLLLAIRLRQGEWRLAALASVVLLTLVVVHPFDADVDPQILELSAIDVGQSESLLLGLPDGSTMLVDASGQLPNPRRRGDGYDPGEEVVSPYLWRRGLRRLDVLVLTHGHEDHAGGAAAVIRNFRPREIWVGAVSPDNLAWARAAEEASRLGIPVRYPKAGETLSKGGIRWTVLSPPAGGAEHTKGGNQDSLVLRTRFGRHTFLLTGDAEKAVEARLLDGGTLGPIDVLKVAHHGSKTASGREFLGVLHPAVAIISAGRDNQYRFPHAPVIEALREGRAVVLRTDRDGLISVRSDGRYLETGSMRTGFTGKAFRDELYSGGAWSP